MFLPPPPHIYCNSWAEIRSKVSLHLATISVKGFQQHQITWMLTLLHHVRAYKSQSDRSSWKQRISKEQQGRVDSRWPQKSTWWPPAAFHAPHFPSNPYLKTEICAFTVIIMYSVVFLILYLPLIKAEPGREVEQHRETAAVPFLLPRCCTKSQFSYFIML